MEVEISGNSFDCSRDWLVALVADNSHVCSPRQGRKPTKSGSCALFLSLLMPQQMRGNPSEMNAKTVKVKHRFDDGFQNDWFRPCKDWATKESLECGGLAPLGYPLTLRISPVRKRRQAAALQSEVY